MEIVRVFQTLFVLYIGLFAGSVVLNNITDYGTNYNFVRHVMSMDTVQPQCRLKWRRIGARWAHHAAYVFIIALEAATALLCIGGAWRMWDALASDAATFGAAKSLAFSGLALGFTVWFAIFMIGAGQWFASWQSQQFNGQDAAFRFYVPIGIVFLILLHPV